MAVTLQELSDAVFTITNRPDLAAETTYAVKAATTRAHNSDEYVPDILNAIVTPTFKEELGVYQVFIQEAPFVRFRRELAVETFPTRAALTKISVDNLFDMYGGLTKDSYYLAGTTINVRVNSMEQLNVSYLTKPNLVDYSSWIADNYTDAIVLGAASMLFDVIGKADEKQRFNNLYMQALMDVRADNILNR